MAFLADISGQGITFLSSLFVFTVGLFFLLILLLFVRDKFQTRDAILHNYPVIGRFRYIFSTLGEFFRQYFFAMDREEMPFNRAERGWVYKSAAGVDNTVAFGSTKNISPPGTPLFVNCPFPTLDEDAATLTSVRIGPYAREPYDATSLINISAMSYGALSEPAVRALSMGAKLAGCWMNTGEGGLASAHLTGGCDIVFQIGTAKYGVRTADGKLDDNKLREVAAHPQVRMFEIKMSQGAKPGKGGILPGAKVTAEIARIRGIEPGKDSISPNRHPEIGSFAELLAFIEHVRDVTGKPTGFKAVIGAYGWLENMCEEIQRCGIACAPDFITIDSADGGTGAAPMPLMDDVGLPIKEALPMVVDILTRYGLRERIKVIASGKLITPSGVAWALCAGADFVASARGFMFALGCIQALKCNKNTCPTGITTHDKHLQQGLNPAEKAVRVKNFVGKIHYGSGLIAHSCGVSHPRELTRIHCRIVQPDGKSVPLSELYPVPEVLEKFRAGNNGNSHAGEKSEEA
ncbi:MAG: FMN-binding glutamate synthase family protein [Gammaproteobacteria bacterium]|nr:FMN-binding glutamate synthase family protein [Gammaproteobacteria bacterium]